MIYIKNITKTYNSGKPDETTPIRNFSMDIPKGSTVILNGPSGSGKSTVLNMIAGLIKPTEGVVEVDGKVISKLPEHFTAEYRRNKVGMIFQQYNLFDSYTVEDNVSLPLLPTGMSHYQISSIVDDMLLKLDMLDKKLLKAEKLSGGEMQRTAIARALINNPEIILADEPTANLDKKLTVDFISLMKRFQSEGNTIIIATHDPIITDSGIADNIIEMSKES